ncbi:MAG: xanthine phosphoribosyltransferase [Clostridia bacterium]|nr:xanthine phosphoribosyltransferase [Clostridia bacterium]MCR5694066.1 xanthine phosphoribosyltransferase [Clostridia bacterium]
MKALEEKILAEGKVCSGDILLVGGFLNQRIDTDFIFQMGKEIRDLFADARVTKIVTVEASGIAIALAAAYYLKVPMVFAKKSSAKNFFGDVYKASVHSYTHGKDYEIAISSEFLSPEDRILVIDDFLATGEAMEGLAEIVKQSGAELAGLCAAIEKGYQGGGDAFRARGIRVESLAIIDEMNGENIKFRS